jgi:hypothetical protein
MSNSLHTLILVHRPAILAQSDTVFVLALATIFLTLACFIINSIQVRYNLFTFIYIHPWSPHFPISSR